MKPPILIVCGPTASGKSEFALEVAERARGEIVSADSMQIYRGMDKGTAKPSAAERARVPHCMIDVADPREPYSVGDYKKAAEREIERIAEEGKVPIVCGGTGFYIDALLYDFSYGGAGKDDAIRAKYEEMARKEGNAAVHAALRRVDPSSACALHPNDLKRVIRALEIYESTGTPKSALSDVRKPVREFAAFSPEWERSALYARIDAREDKMIDGGLVREVEELLAAGVPETCTAMQGIGYKEVVAFLNNCYNVSTMRDIIKQNTRNYAKRQIVYFKRMPNLVRFSECERDAAEESAVRIAEEFRV